jgi:hypothetical protein
MSYAAQEPAMMPISDRSTEAEIFHLLKVQSEVLWGSERTREIEAALKSASRNIHILFQMHIGPRDEEPDYVDNAADCAS